MPALRPKKRAPQATLGKRLRHTLLLVQPILQFAALVFVMIFLTRCSPLSPSTDKNPLKPLTSGDQRLNANAEAEALEQAIIKNLKEIHGSALEAVSDDELGKLGTNALRAGLRLDAASVRSTLSRRANQLGLRHIRPQDLPLLKVELAPDQILRLAEKGSVRIEIHVVLKELEDKARQTFFAELLKLHPELGARSYFVAADDATQDDLEGVPTEFSVGVLATGDKAYLEVRLNDEGRRALATNLAGLRKLAVVLE